MRCILVMLLVRLTLFGVFFAVPPSHALGTHPQHPTTVASEGSLRDMAVAPSLGAKPGVEPGFYNPQRRIGRDLVVLSVARWLLVQANSSDAALSGRPAPRLLDATCAAGIQGLRAAVESPFLARAAAAAAAASGENDCVETSDNPVPTASMPELQVVLNDAYEDAIKLARTNAERVSNSTSSRLTVASTQRVAQALLHEESFDVCVLDAFGSPAPLLDAALARAPHGGLLEVCATDVVTLYGGRPSVARRHYGARFAEKRPPCYRERGVRLLLAAVAQAAGRHDRGVVPVWAVSRENFCMASLQVVRGGRGADATAKQVQNVRICRTCGDYGLEGAAPKCRCGPDDGAGKEAPEEGPLWTGQLYDAMAVQDMAELANFVEAEGLISKKTRTLLAILRDEASVDGIFHRRPGFSADGRTPKLAEVLIELTRQGYSASRTHFDSKALRTDASADQFDLAVMAALKQPRGTAMVSS